MFEIPIPSLQGGFLFAVFFFPACYLVSALYAWRRLRNIPGPFLGAFSYLWLARVATSREQEARYREINKTYGPLARVGPNELITDDPDLLRKLGSARSRYGKDKWYISSRFDPYQDTMGVVLDSRRHDQIRAQLTPAYSGRDVESLESCVDDQVGAMIRLLRTKYVVTADNSSPLLLDLGSVTSYLTVDVISRVLFGNEFGYLRDDSDSHGFLKQLRDHLATLVYFIDVAWLRSIAFSKTFLMIFGPKTTDTKGVGRMMGYVTTLPPMPLLAVEPC